MSERVDIWGWSIWVILCHSTGKVRKKSTFMKLDKIAGPDLTETFKE